MAEWIWKEVDWPEEDESKGMPTLEEFRERVKYYFWAGWPSKTEDKIEEFMNSELGRRLLVTAYEDEKVDYKAGEVTRDQIMGSSAAAAGMNLEYCYEP